MKKMKKSIILLCIVTCGFTLNAQIFINKNWEYVNGTTDTVNTAPIVGTGGGNVVVSGNEKITGQMTNFRTAFLNAVGANMWLQTFNNTPNNNDFGTVITKDNAGNVYVGGASYTSVSNNLDLSVIKYNSAGVQQWIKNYNGPGSSYDIASGIVVDNSGNVYVTGPSTGVFPAMLDYVTIKYNSSGVQQWVSRYNFANGLDIPAGISLDNSGNVIVSGSSASSPLNNNWDFATVKYNSATGAQMVVVRKSNTGNAQDKVLSQTQDAAGNIYVTGATSSTGTNFNIQTIKYNSALVQQWVKTYDGYGMDDYGNSIALDGSGNVIVGGYSDKPGSMKEMVLIKYDNNGNLLWKRTKQPQINSGIAEIQKVVIDPNNDIYLGGYYITLNQDIAILKYNSSGEVKFEKTYNGIGNSTDIFMDLSVEAISLLCRAAQQMAALKVIS
jgi:hypothetical protein